MLFSVFYLLDGVFGYSFKISFHEFHAPRSPTTNEIPIQGASILLYVEKHYESLHQFSQLINAIVISTVFILLSISFTIFGIKPQFMVKFNLCLTFSQDKNRQGK